MDRHQAAELLRWYAGVGADEAVGDEPVDRFRAAATAGRRTAATAGRQAFQSQPSVPQQPFAAPPAPAADARGSGPGPPPATRSSLPQSVPSTAVPLKRTATTTCICDGNPDAQIMIVGEAPGGARGPSGASRSSAPRASSSTGLLAAVGLDRTTTYITNTLYWRPPGNRAPTPEELAQCLPFLERQVELLAPKLLIYAGATAVKAMLGTTEGITRLRGRWFSLRQPERDPIPAMPMFHPAYLLRQPARKRDSWRDLLAVRAKMAELGISPESAKARD